MLWQVFSTRSALLGPQNHVSRALAEAKASGRQILDLTCQDPTLLGFPYDHEGLARALGLGAREPHRPTALGLPEARRAVADVLGQTGPAVEPDTVVLTSSTSEAYSFVFTLLCDPGDAILVPEPSYPLLTELLRLSSVEAVPYRLSYDGAWHVDVQSIDATPRTRGILVVNPNNPTGHYLDRDDLRVLERLGLPIIADEVFASYALEPSARSVRAVRVSDMLCFTLGGLSKLAGLPQMKCAWVALSGPDPEVVEALARLEMIADAFLSLSGPVQHALPQLLAARHVTADAIEQRARRNIETLRTRLLGTPVEALRVEGGWSAVLRLPSTRDDEAWVTTLLAERQVWVQPGFLYDFSGPPFVVLSLLTHPEQFEDGVCRLLAHVARHV